MSEDESSSKPPRWITVLENRQKKQHRLAHDIGAGAPCMKCGDSCPGLDLHFWRKLCRNCKCKKEDHDIVDDESYLQFDILLSSSGAKAKVKPAKAVLDLKLKKEDVKLVAESHRGIKDDNKGIVFDWIPPDISNDLAAEYMQQLPPNKMPITGSTGAHHRRQQLEYQIPLHDLTPNVCHDLTVSEIQGLKDYLENVRSNVVGQGRIQKIGVISNQYVEYSVPVHTNRPASSVNLNSVPKPFVSIPYDINSPYLHNEKLPSSTLEGTNTPLSGLKTPSEFLNKDYRREKSPLRNTSSQNSTGSSHQLQDPSEILRDVSKSPTVLDKQFAPISILNLQNNNEIDPNSTYDSNPLAPNLNDMLHGTLNTVNDNNSTSKPITGSLVKNTLPYQVINSDNSHMILKPDNAQLLCHFLDSKETSPNFDPKNSLLQDGTVQTNTLPIFVQHSNPTNIQEPSLVHSIHRQPEEHTFIHQQGFESAPQGYRQVPDQFNKIEDSMNSLSINDRVNSPLQVIKIPPVITKSLNCFGCLQVINVGQVAVLAERAGNSVAWHPQCFVCYTCKELLVDLIYFFHKGNVYCGRHYADMMQIPRCFACDELIFVNEYTMAEGQAFHVRHFCCFECDEELAGKCYIPKNDHPVCLDCYHKKYSQICNTCKQIIGATEKGLRCNHLHWHASDSCFYCFQCLKPLLGSRFLIKNAQPFCSKDCATQYFSN